MTINFQFLIKGYHPLVRKMSSNKNLSFNSSLKDTNIEKRRTPPAKPPLSIPH